MTESKQYLEIHFYLNDDSHSIDAEIYSKCSTQLILITKEIARILNTKISLEVEAIEPGGVKQIFSVTGVNKLIPSTKQVGELLKLCAVGIVIDVTSNYISNYDPLDHKLKKADLIIKEEQVRRIEEAKKLRDAKSAYYKSALISPKIKEIGFAPLDENKAQIKEQFKLVRRENFNKFISSDENQNVIYDHNAVIYVVAPVINKTKNGKLQWHGIYNGNQIQFLVGDSNFQKDIISRKHDLDEMNTISVALAITTIRNPNGDKIPNSERYRADIVYKYNDKVINDRWNHRPKITKSSQLPKKELEQQSLFE